MLYRIWPLLKEVYHYEKHLVMFANPALIVMGLLLLVRNENDGFQNLWFFLMPATLRGCRARPSRCCPASSLWPTSPTATAAGARRTPKSPRSSASVPDMRSTHSAWKSCAECSLKGRKKEDAPCRTKR